MNPSNPYANPPADAFAPNNPDAETIADAMQQLVEYAAASLCDGDTCLECGGHDDDCPECGGYGTLDIDNDDEHDALRHIVDWARNITRYQSEHAEGAR